MTNKSYELFNSLLLGSFLIIFLFSNVSGQEKSEEKTSPKQKEAAERKTKDPQTTDAFKFNPKAKTRFKVQFSPCERNCENEPKNQLPVIVGLHLNKTKLRAKDSLKDPENNLKINVLTCAEDAEGDALTYRYAVSSGSIIGEGKKVVWDLTGAKTGAYTIKVSVNDGADLYKNTMIKTVRIKQ